MLLNMNWYNKQIKKSWNTWEPLMDTISDKGQDGYDTRRRPYPESEESMTQANPFFGGETRETDHHHGNNDLTDDGKVRSTLPGEETLMDKGHESTGLTGEEFKANGDWGHYREEDGRNLGGKSDKADKGPIGSHNMQNRGFYNKYKKRIKIPTFNTL